MDLTNQLGLMRALPQRCRPLLQRRRSVIASSDRMLISAIAQLFDGVGPLVGAATSEAAALQCLCSGGIELLVCTDQLDQGSGPALVAAAKQRHPSIRCLMLIQRPLRSTIEAALQAGCDGLCSPERLGRGGLLSVLEAMGSDGSHLDRGISALLQRGDHCVRTAQPPRLTLREETLLKGLCRGLSNQDIAAELHLSINTVKHGVTALLRKFDARDRSQVILAAFELGLMSPPFPTPPWSGSNAGNT